MNYDDSTSAFVPLSSEEANSIIVDSNFDFTSNAYTITLALSVDYFPAIFTDDSGEVSFWAI